MMFKARLEDVGHRCHGAGTLLRIAGMPATCQDTCPGVRTTGYLARRGVTGKIFGMLHPATDSFTSRLPLLITAGEKGPSQAKRGHRELFPRRDIRESCRGQ